MKLQSLFILSILIAVAGVLAASKSQAQTARFVPLYDSIKLVRNPGESLNEYKKRQGVAALDSRMLGAAVYAANILADTAGYEREQGVPLNQLFNPQDLAYLSSRGLPTVVALFEELNDQLPEGKKIEFVVDSLQTVTVVTNPLALEGLKAKISENPADLYANRSQWKDNVYLAYMAREYGTALNNTITITSTTHLLRERPDLALITTDGSELSLGQMPGAAEGDKVRAARLLTFPNGGVSKETANENYRRMMLALIDLQEADFMRHPASAELIERMTADLKLGPASKILAAIQGSRLFDANVPGNLGPVLLTESTLMTASQLSNNAKAKALELMTLTALHYGERDAVKLFNRLLASEGTMPAAASGEFSTKRLGELRYHGAEKLRAVGFGPDKTAGVTMADLVLLAVAAPQLPVISEPNAALTLTEAGERIVAAYSTVIMEESKRSFLLGPRASLGTRHMEYQAASDAVHFTNGAEIAHNGFELRLESDLYFADLEKMMAQNLKPFIYPELGVIMGTGKRKIGYGDRGSVGPHGAVPQFKQSYINWGGHLGLNVGPVLIGLDATVLSTKSEEDPYRRFFDLSQSMTYYRYSFLARILNLGINKVDAPRPLFLTLDFEVSGETNNEGTGDRTRTQTGGSQIGSDEWQRDYAKAHPNGQYNHAIATQMIMDGEVKAAYPAANYAALHAGLSRGAFDLKVTAGLYNLKAIDGYHDSKFKWLGRLAENTFKGNGFAAATLTYNFGAIGAASRRRSTKRSSTINGRTVDMPEESSYETQKVQTGLRNRAIFMNTRGN